MANFPLPKFHFSVEWGGANIGFTEVSGLNFELDVMEYRDGVSPDFFKKKQPGMHKWGNVTMKRGTCHNDNEFYDWYNTVALNTVEKRDITISLLNASHEPTVVWKVKECFISKLQCTDLKSDANDPAIESVEIVHNGFTLEHV